MANIGDLPFQSVKSTLPDYLEQLAKTNKFAIEVLNALSNLSYGNDDTISIELNGTTYNFKNVNFLSQKLDRIERELRRLTGVDGNGVFIQIDENVVKKIISVNLNDEPNPINGLELITNFTTKKNQKYEDLMNPLLTINFDLTNKINNDVDRIQSSRYIINFEQSNGILTVNGSTALADFGVQFQNRNDVNFDTFRTWLGNTRGVSFDLDEQIFDLDPAIPKFRGLFNVISQQEDFSNGKIWYELNDTIYIDTEFQIQKSLNINDLLIINTSTANSIYKILEINTQFQSPLIRVERIEGKDPIPVGIGTLKIYATTTTSKILSVSVGYGEYNVVFLKSINNTNIISNEFSNGVGYFTNDLRLADNGNLSGTSLQDYYVNFVEDPGSLLKDLAQKNLPAKFGVPPTSPSLNQDLFRVEQINNHKTNQNQSKKLNDLNNEKNTIKEKLNQLDTAIQKIKANLQTRKTSESERQSLNADLDKTIRDYESQNKLYAAKVSEINSIAKETSEEDYKFRVRGFWEYPIAVSSPNTRPQEVVQFEVRYKYISNITGQDNPATTFKITDNQNAAFTSWNYYLTKSRNRIFNPITQKYDWETEDLNNADVVNSNQLDIPISLDESVVFQIRSISEIGFPENPLKSDWSNQIEINFPENLRELAFKNRNILSESQKEEIFVRVQSDLTAKGLTQHIAKSTALENKYFAHPAEEINSSIFDSNGQPIDLRTLLESFRKEIDELKSADDLGNLEIIFKNGDEEIPIESYGGDKEIVIYLDDKVNTAPTPSWDASGINTNTKYIKNSNYIYDNISLIIRNKSTKQPIKLFTSKLTTINSGDRLTTYGATFSESGNKLIMQKDNQWIWLKTKDSETNSLIYKKLESKNDAVDYGNLNIGIWQIDSTTPSQNQNTGGVSSISNEDGFPSDIQFVSSGDLEYKTSNKTIFELFTYLNNNGNPKGQIFSESNGMKYLSNKGTNTSNILSGSFIASIHPELPPNFSNFFNGKLFSLPENTTYEIPINIYFKYFHLSLDENLVFIPQSGNVQPINKQIIFEIQPEKSSRSIEFSITFTIYPYRPNTVSRTNAKIKA